MWKICSYKKKQKRANDTSSVILTEAVEDATEGSENQGLYT